MRKEIGMVENSALYQKLPFYEGEEEKLLTFCGAEGYAITVYNREELDELAYKVHASNNLSALTRKEFFELRANDRKAHVRLVKSWVMQLAVELLCTIWLTVKLLSYWTPITRECMHPRKLGMSSKPLEKSSNVQRVLNSVSIRHTYAATSPTRTTNKNNLHPAS